MVQLKSKCENEAKKQAAVRDMTHEMTLNYILRKKYVQKDFENWEIQVKKNDGKTSNDGDASTTVLKQSALSPVMRSVGNTQIWLIYEE
jgi:hypothetical protein